MIKYAEHGGAHWNSGDSSAGVNVWTAAIERFPDHELSAKLKREFSDPATSQPGDGAR
jgi:hypothetical protein